MTKYQFISEITLVGKTMKGQERIYQTLKSSKVLNSTTCKSIELTSTMD